MSESTPVAKDQQLQRHVVTILIRRTPHSPTMYLPPMQRSLNICWRCRKSVMASYREALSGLGAGASIVQTENVQVSFTNFPNSSP
ncbi:uncharacterized protein EKO05_0002590 [Ascochyta rabiei]|uniref:uncharacterized protein n=1 Tax=Didymella rabiei TaxID=5454 RepID=UPI0021FE4E2C|nr:uncharacterized protein EKO05_0002590 [Ascochyta rabiei]UPX12012.1 hypothetical protein EKO05_0002590 [Ascochyta rabiei]